MNTSWKYACALLVCMLPIREADAQSRVDFGQVTRPVARIERPEIIRFIFNQLIIEPRDSTVALEVIDITQNGFGPDDVLVSYPSMETFKIDPLIVTDTVQSLMGQWAPEAEFRHDAGNAPAAFFDPELASADVPGNPSDPFASAGDSLGVTTDSLNVAQGVDADSLLNVQLEDDLSAPTTEARLEPVQKAEQAIMHELLLAIERNYGADIPIKLRLDRSDVGFTFQMWDYSKDAMHYVPRPSGIPDTTTAFDLLYLTRHDSTVVTDTTLYDVIYLVKTVEDVVYIPEGTPPTSSSNKLPPGTPYTRPGSAAVSRK